MASGRFRSRYANVIPGGGSASDAETAVGSHTWSASRAGRNRDFFANTCLSSPESCTYRSHDLSRHVGGDRSMVRRGGPRSGCMCPRGHNCIRGYHVRLWMNRCTVAEQWQLNGNPPGSLRCRHHCPTRLHSGLRRKRERV